MPLLTQSQLKSNGFLSRIRDTPNAILHYDLGTDNLAIWYWPINERGERVTPSDLERHRQLHHIRAPCCLCALEDDGSSYTETAVMVATSGRLSGEYIAVCVKDRCGYLVFLERIHCKQGVPIRYYPKRDTNHPALPLVIRDAYGTMESGDSVRPRKRLRAELINVDRIKTYRPSILATTSNSVFSQLLRLDSAIQPGLTQDQFRELLAKCSECGLVMTRRIFFSHGCEGKEGQQMIDFIDLTGDSDIEID